MSTVQKQLASARIAQTAQQGCRGCPHNEEEFGGAEGSHRFNRQALCNLLNRLVYLRKTTPDCIEEQQIAS